MLLLRTEKAVEAVLIFEPTASARTTPLSLTNGSPFHNDGPVSARRCAHQDSGGKSEQLGSHVIQFVL